MKIVNRLYVVRCFNTAKEKFLFAFFILTENLQQMPGKLKKKKKRNNISYIRRIIYNFVQSQNRKERVRE